MRLISQSLISLNYSLGNRKSKEVPSSAFYENVLNREIEDFKAKSQKVWKTRFCEPCNAGDDEQQD